MESRGWERWNLSQEHWQGNYYAWFQGNGGNFSPPDMSHPSFAAVNYLNTVQGTLSVWLVKPEIQITGSDVLAFSLRSDVPWTDSLRVHGGAGSATTAADFTTTIFGLGDVPEQWIDIQVFLPQMGSSVRIAFEYYGTFAGSNYLGLDTVSVTSTVPDAPAAWLLAAGLAGVALRVRRSTTAPQDAR